jgi:pimeloyl-ACP methyl ester carboxylesterase
VIHYQRRGSGEPLVLLHGIGHHWRAWEPVVGLLAERHDVIAPDLPGFGRSPAPASHQGMPDAVEHMLAFFAELGLEKPHVAGNSLGGAIALELAAIGAVASCTAICPAGFASPAQARRALRLLSAMRFGSFTPAPILKVLYATRAGRSATFSALVTRPANLDAERALDDTLMLRRGKGFRAVKRAGRTYSFEKPITVPVTVAWSTKDAVLPYAQASVARRRLPRARHVELAGLGHVPMSDDPGRVAAVILETTAATGNPV